MSRYGMVDAVWIVIGLEIVCVDPAVRHGCRAFVLKLAGALMAVIAVPTAALGLPGPFPPLMMAIMGVVALIVAPAAKALDERTRTGGRWLGCQERFLTRYLRWWAYGPLISRLSREQRKRAERRAERLAKSYDLHLGCRPRVRKERPSTTKRRAKSSAG